MHTPVASRPERTASGTGRSPARTTRRAASAFIVPVMLAGLVSLQSPAEAATTSSTSTTSGICNGVMNQLAHRGQVQENILKAAARKNADQIAALQAQRATLQRPGPTPSRGRSPMRSRPSPPSMRRGSSSADIPDSPGPADSQQTSTTAAVADGEKALANLEAERATIVAQLSPLLDQLAAAEPAAGPAGRRGARCWTSWPPRSRPSWT
jgi:hypothetical protein